MTQARGAELAAQAAAMDRDGNGDGAELDARIYAIGVDTAWRLNTQAS